MMLAKEPALTPEYEQLVRSFIPNLKYETSEGVSHFVMIDKAREFNPAVASSLKANGLLEN